MRHIRSRHRYALGTALLLLAGALLATFTHAGPEEDARPYYTEGMHGVDLSGVTEAQRELALKILNAADCPCGCGMTVAQCRVEDQNCTRSPALARAIVDAVRRGESEEEVWAAYRKALGDQGPARPNLPPEVYDIAIEDSPFRGEESAPVTIIQFTDFHCPFCLRAQRVLGDLFEEYPGKLKLVFKHLPLAIHPGARTAALAAEAARRQGKFWEMHDRLFRSPSALDREGLLQQARELGLDLERFQADLDSAAVAARVDRDLAEAERVGAAVTPTYFVNGRRIRNFQMATFRVAIERALAGDRAAARP